MDHEEENKPSKIGAYVILAGTSFWAITQTSPRNFFAMGTYSFLLGHSLVEIFHYSHFFDNLRMDTMMDKVSKVAVDIAVVMPLPLINTELYLIHKMHPTVAYLHALTVAFPIATRFFHRHVAGILTDMIIFGNIVSLIYLSVHKECPWASGLGISAIYNRFMYAKLAKRFSQDNQNEHIVGIGLVFFSVFAVNCIHEAKICALQC